MSVSWVQKKKKKLKTRNRVNTICIVITKQQHYPTVFSQWIRVFFKKKKTTLVPK